MAGNPFCQKKCKTWWLLTNQIQCSTKLVGTQTFSIKSRTRVLAAEFPWLLSLPLWCLEVVYIAPSIHLLPAVPIKCRCGRVVNSRLISKCKCTLQCVLFPYLQRISKKWGNPKIYYLKTMWPMLGPMMYSLPHHLMVLLFQHVLASKWTAQSFLHSLMCSMAS